jgi:hypothetical protein
VARQVRVTLESQQSRQLAERLDVLVGLVDEAFHIVGVQHVLAAVLMDKPQTNKFSV